MSWATLWRPGIAVSMLRNFPSALARACGRSKKSGTTYSLRLFPLGGYNLFSQPPEEDADPPAEESAPPRKAALFPLTVSGQQFEQAHGHGSASL